MRASMRANVLRLLLTNFSHIRKLSVLSIATHSPLISPGRSYRTARCESGTNNTCTHCEARRDVDQLFWQNTE